MDSLAKLREASEAKLIPRAMAKRVESKMKNVFDGVAKVEKASGLRYPPYYVEPLLVVSTSGQELGELGVLYARTIPLEVESRLEIWIQLSAALVAFGSKTTVRTVLAHEFLHYVELAKRLVKFEVASEEVSTTLFEATYRDYEALAEPSKIFKDKALVRLLKKKFSDGLVDTKLQENTVKMWLEAKLPTVNLPPEGNVIRIPAAIIPEVNLDPGLIARLEELERQPVNLD